MTIKNHLIRLEGPIDLHVHLRDPGETHKEDFESGTRAALAGGITAVCDMPNNKVPILTYELLKEKIIIATQKAVCDWGLYFGSTGTNLSEFIKVVPLVAGLKLYLNQTTGNLNITDSKTLHSIFKAWPKDKLIILHAEGEMVDLALYLAKNHGNKIHLTHISTQNNLQKIIDAKLLKLSVTCDVTPHHLFLTAEDEAYLNGKAAVKPPLALKSDVDFLWDNLKYIDAIASDHAPHTLSEKKQFDPPFGLPGLETSLPLILTAFSKKRLTLQDVFRLTVENPLKILGIAKRQDTYTEIALGQKYTLLNKNLNTKCGWSPFNKWTLFGQIKKVVIRGTEVYKDGKVLVEPGFGQNLIN